MKIGIVIVTLGLLGGGVIAGLPALAGDGVYPVVKDKDTIEACGECHMVFQPRMLPARSWRKIMQGLDDHFGEDASIDPALVPKIEQYLVANASDVGWDDELMKGVRASSTPLRITELPKWVHEHEEELPSHIWSRADIGSKANCLACHRGANKGYYED